MNTIIEEDKVKLSKLSTDILKLEKEANRLGDESYSQSNPSAMMERRDNRRWLAKAHKEYEAILSKYKNIQ